MGVLDLGYLNRIANVEEYNEQINALSRAVESGKNIFNKEAVIDGKYIDANGIIKENENYYMIYIPVDININKTVGIKNGTNCALCDINKNIIDGTIASGNNASFTLTPDSKYFLVSGLKSNINNQIVNYGTLDQQAGDYVHEAKVNVKVGDEVSVNVDNFDEMVIADIRKYDKNLVDNTRWMNGTQLVSDTGAERTDQYTTSYATTDWIPVNAKIFPTINVLVRNGVAQNNFWTVHFYDVNKNHLNVVIPALNTPIPIPSDAMFMRACIISRNTTYGYEAVVKYACFSINWMDLKPYSGGSMNNMITKDDIIPYFRFGGTVESPSLVVSGDAGACITTYIPIKPNTKYFVQSSQETNLNGRYAHFYGRNKEDLGVVYTGEHIGYDNIITTPYNAYYVVFSFMDSWWDKNDSRHFIGMIEAEKWDGKVGTVVAEDDVVRASILDGPFPCGRNRILGIMGDYIAMMNFDNTRIRFSASGWDAKPYYVGSTLIAGGWVEVEINSTNFPGYVSGGISQVVFFTKSTGSAISGIGCLVFGASNNGIWYCSDVTNIRNLTFAVPNIWDMKGNKSWRIDADVAANKKTDSKGVTRYRMYYPSDQASRHGQWMWHNGPLWMEGAGGQYSRGVLFGNYSNHSADNPSPNCLYYTDNGEDIYVMYEFGVAPKRYKVAGDSSVKTRTWVSVNYCAGDAVDVSDGTLFPSGSAFTALTMKKRYSIVPSEGTPDPTAIFEYDETGTTISAVSGTSFTLADASGFQVGDIVILEGTATGGYANLLTTSIDGTTKVGNGPVFVITAINGSNVTLADIVGNPKNNLFCRHIHGVTEFGQGICIYAGEDYPESWFIYMNPYFGDVANGTNPNNNQWITDTISLNSSANAFQRALGIILRPDGKCVYIADSNQPQSAKLQVRGKDIKMGNYGVMVFPLEDIDDNSKALTKINGVNAGYALYNLGNILFYSDYYGKTYYSTDWGDSWKYICTDGTTKSFMIGWDKNKKRFYFNQTRGTQFAIEVK